MARNRKSARRQRLEAAVVYPLDWLEERSGLVGGVRYFLFRKVPADTNWMQTLGSATLTAFIVQAVTGVILAMYYKPDPNSAYQSVKHISNDVWLGWLVRGMHRWGASVFIILMFFHMARVFLFGAYKYPRELNWIVGVMLLALGMLEGFTGYLLPWDQTAYWATVVGININGTAPFLGPFLAQFLRGGAEIGPETLARFYSIHMLLLPGAIIGLILLHLYLVALAVIWKFTIPGNHEGTESGLLGPLYTDKADPGTTNFVPRPDWYFYFLFYLLRIFKWPESVILGTVGIPTILLIILFVLPFLDLRRERRLLRRPVAIVAALLTRLSMGVLTHKGAAAKEALASEVVQAVPTWAKREGFAGNQQALAGARLFAQSGCPACHTYLGTGSSNLGAPDLSAIGKGNQGQQFFSRYVSDPSQFGNKVMPKFGNLGSQQNIRNISVFLSVSKGPK